MNPQVPKKKAIQQRSLATRNFIIEAAARFLRDHSWDHLTTNKLAEMAGISIGTLYQHFSNKEEIIRELFKQRFEKDYEAVRNIFEKYESSEIDVIIRKLIQLCLNLFTENVHLRRLTRGDKFILMGERSQLNAKILAVLLENFDRYSKGKYKRPSQVGMYILITSVIETITTACHHEPEKLKDPEFEEELFSLVTGYLNQISKKD